MVLWWAGSGSLAAAVLLAVAAVLQLPAQGDCRLAAAQLNAIDTGIRVAATALAATSARRPEIDNALERVAAGGTLSTLIAQQFPKYGELTDLKQRCDRALEPLPFALIAIAAWVSLWTVAYLVGASFWRPARRT